MQNVITGPEKVDITNERFSSQSSDNINVRRFTQFGTTCTI